MEKGKKSASIVTYCNLKVPVEDGCENKICFQRIFLWLYDKSPPEKH